MVDPRGEPAPPPAQHDAELPGGGSSGHVELPPAYASTLDRVLSLVDEHTSEKRDEAPHKANAQPSAQLRVGFVESRQGMIAQVTLLGSESSESLAIAPHVDGTLIDRAVTDHSLVLLGEWNNQSTIIGLIQTKLPDHTLISGKNIVIEASEQLTLRSGRAAIALRSDGALEMMGTRIAATSRGVFRLIGRALRLN